jgi:hypothetical protein
MLNTTKRSHNVYYEKKQTKKQGMKTRVVAALVATMLLLSLAIPVLAQTDSEDQITPTPETTPVKDPYLEEYLPCTNARYRAWYGAS